MAADKGVEPSDTVPGAELLHAALTVLAVEIYVDPETLDRIFVIHSEEREPVVLRVSPVDLPGILAHLSARIAKSLN
jgi:hypothetical protein